MVFTSTKQEANELALSSALKQECQVLHGDIPQRQREVTLKVSKFIRTIIKNWLTREELSIFVIHIYEIWVLYSEHRILCMRD